MEPLLKSSGFVNVVVNLKEESRDFIAKWLPGSGCEKYVVSAEITARKPMRTTPAAAAAEVAADTPAEAQAGADEGC